MRLARPNRATALISLVPMIDVLLILLVFFMVTSTYLDLDMIPARSPDQASLPPAGPTTPGSGAGQSLLLRIGADDRAVLRGEPLAPDDLRDRLQRALAQSPQMQLLILPSASASTQGLVSVLDAAAEAGVSQLRVLQLEARP